MSDPGLNAVFITVVIIINNVSHSYPTSVASLLNKWVIKKQKKNQIKIII